ncbi:MAG TPA: hypothetical protein VG983_11435, partial [Caulobacterales bacterium]|nr:hypothetical protein [Caulobacterales bacterium]
MKRTCVAALLFALAIGLGSCGPQGAGRSVQAVAPEASAPAPPPQADTAAADDKAAAPNDQAPNTPAGGTMLAYAYAYGLEV